MQRSSGGQLLLSITVDREGDKVFIALAGDLSLSSQAEFEEKLRELYRERVMSVLVDLSSLTFMDSTGLFLLLNLWKRCHREGIGIVFEGGSQEIQDLFEVTAMDQILPVVPPGGSSTTGRRGSSAQLSHRLRGPSLL